MKRIIFFDFDGVIVDTLALSVDIFKKQYPAMTANILREWFEGNVLTEVRRHGISTDDFFAEYTKRLPLLPPIDDMPAVLTELAENYPLVVISSSVSTILDDYLEQYDLRRSFVEVLGSDMAHQKRDNFQRALAQRKVAATDCVFVTDTLGDIHEAHSSHIPTVAALWGFHAPDVLAQGNPAGFATTPQELPSVVHSLFSDL